MSTSNEEQQAANQAALEQAGADTPRTGVAHQETDREPKYGTEGIRMSDAADQLLKRKEEPQESKEEAKAEPEKEPEQQAQETQTEDGVQEAPEEATEELAEEISTLQEFLETNDLSHDDVMELSVTTKVNGDDRPTTLKELIKSYQLEGVVQKKSHELAKEKETFQQEVEARQEQLNQTVEQLNQAGQVVQSMLFSEFQGVNWEELKASDPLEYQSQRQDYEDKAKQVQTVFATVQQHNQTQAEANAEAFKKYVDDQTQETLIRIPSWSDTKVAEKDNADIKKYLSNKGYGKQEIEQISDARMMDVLYDAMRYNRIKDAKPGVKKKVKTAPKVVKSGSRKPESTKSQGEVDAMANLKRNRKRTDAVNVLLQRQKG
jgi:hypothetical protein